MSTDDVVGRDGLLSVRVVDPAGHLLNPLGRIFKRLRRHSNPPGRAVELPDN